MDADKGRVNEDQRVPLGLTGSLITFWLQSGPHQLLCHKSDISDIPAGVVSGDEKLTDLRRNM